MIVNPPTQNPPFATELGQLARYRDLLIDWNQRINLTAMKSGPEIDRWLIGDSLRMLPAIDQLLERPDAQLIDIGTGAGFPGLALKIARPALRVTLVDSTRKKIDFLRAVIDDLGLSGVEAIHARAEELGHDFVHRERYDIATARAVIGVPSVPRPR